ncbi:tetratricopeptide repeat (TPR)-like superfamily protein [Wolffia australiana]
MDIFAAAATAKFAVLRPRAEERSIEPNTEALKQRLIRRGVVPSPKIIRTLRKKEIQKAARRSKKKTADDENPPLSEAEKQLQEEESLFRTISSEYRAVKDELRRRDKWRPAVDVAGKPWQRSNFAVDPASLAGSNGEDIGGRLRSEPLAELAEMLSERNSEDLQLLLDDDVEELPVEKGRAFFLPRRLEREEDQIRFLVERLSGKGLTIQDWKFSRIMKLSGLLFTERNLLKIVEELGNRGSWRQAMDVVEWVYCRTDNKRHKSRFVYTKLLSVLGKSRRATEALAIFTVMQEDYQTYPDMAAYHSIAVTLGQAGLLKELVNVMECMKIKPSKRPRNVWRRDWDPSLQPDVVIYNAMLNACVASKQWKGVFWVFEKIRSGGLRPNGATYGLAMEVMLESGKYEHVHKFFEKMQRNGIALKALTYKVLVKTLWKENKLNEAVKTVRDMEQRGIVGSAGLYYELACYLCNHGRWKEAMLEVRKMTRLPLTRPLEVAFTGMIQSSMDGGHFHHCISIFEHMKDYCKPNIGTINAMLRVYDRGDMFSKARDLFESVKHKHFGSGTKLDSFSFWIMLEAAANAHQWEYFEWLYREMTLSGFTLDQGMHAWLLVEASRAGKWHLLEHAFDAILEGGDVPSVSLFTEMVIQNLAREDYFQAVKMVNCMAHASINYNEKQWADLFSSNQDRINQIKLGKFHQALDCSSVVAESPVPSLINSLQSLCLLERFPRNSRKALISDIDGKEETTVDGELLECAGADPNLNQKEHGFKMATHFSENESFDSFDDESATDTALDLLTGDVDFTSDSSRPSASHILDVWRERRMKDGVFSNLLF